LQRSLRLLQLRAFPDFGFAAEVGVYRVKRLALVGLPASFERLLRSRPDQSMSGSWTKVPWA